MTLHTPWEYIEDMSDQVTDAISTKLRKIEGQVSGIRTMYDGERSCLEIVQQIAAVRSVLSGVAKDLLAGEASRCARTKMPEDFDRILKSLLDLS